MNLINNQVELDSLCLELLEEPEVCIDTEFMRRVTYYSKLCLIQVASSKHRCIIDPLSGINLDSFAKVLLKNKVLKILHSPREDFEIFYRVFKVVPCNIFDTQIAADLCGIGASISYGELCRTVLGVELDKKHQTDNWFMRPLSDNMLAYAIKDVDYLKPLYDYLNARLMADNLKSKFEKRQNVLRSPKSYIVDPDNAWRKVSFNMRYGDFLRKMQAVAALREECAMHADVPRRHFASDHDLVKICDALPTTVSALRKIRMSTRYFNTSRYQTRLFELCEALKLETPVLE